MLLLREIEGGQVGLGVRRDLERFDDVGGHGIFAEQIADLALAEAAPAEKIEMEEAEERACRELLAELVILEAGAGDAVEKPGTEVERELAVPIAHHGTAVTDHADRLAELAHRRGEDERRIVADVGRLVAGRQFLRHGLADLVEGVGEERLAMERAAA